MTPLVFVKLLPVGWARERKQEETLEAHCHGIMRYSGERWKGSSRRQSFSGLSFIVCYGLNVCSWPLLPAPPRPHSYALKA